MRRELRLRGASITISLILVLAILLGFAVNGIFTSEYAYADTYGYPQLSNVNYFVPNTQFSNYDTEAFPGRLNNEYSSRGGATLIEKGAWKPGENLDLTNFNVNGRNGADGEFSVTSNAISHKIRFNPGNNVWRYMFGYVEIPDALRTGNIEIEVVADTAGFNSANATCDKYFSVAAGNMLFGRDEGPAKSKFNATDLSLNQTTWVTNKEMGLHANPSSMNDSIIIGRQSVKLTIKSSDKYLRISYIAMNNVGDAIVGQKLSNVRIMTPDMPDYYDFARTQNKSDFVPGAVNWGDLTIDGFSEGVNNDIDKGGANLIESWSPNTPIGLTNFTSSGKVNLGDNYLIYNDNEMEATAKSDRNDAQQFWRYMFGYVKLPTDLEHYGGTLTLTAKTAGTFNNTNVSKKMLSLVTGTRLDQNKKRGLNATDLYQNKSKGGSSIENGTQSTKTRGQLHELAKDQTVTINVNPGDSIARISYVYFYREPGEEVTNYVGSYMSDVRLDYVPNDTDAPVISEVRVEATQDGKNALVKANVSDGQYGTIKSVQLVGEGISVDMAGSNGTYQATTTKNGTYKVVATDKGGTTTTYNDVKVSVLDSIGPSLGVVTGMEDIGFGAKTVTFVVTDNMNDIGEVVCKLNGEVIPITRIASSSKQATFSFNAKAGIYSLEMKDTAGNANNSNKISVRHVIEIGDIISTNKNTLELDSINGKNLTIKVTAPAGYKAKAPVVKYTSSMKELYNYGIEAKYTFTFDTFNNNDVSQKIVPVSDPIKTTIAIDDGTPVTLKYGDIKSYDAPEKFGQLFAGWYDEKGALITENRHIDVLMNRNIRLTYKYITEQDINITYRNLAGHVVEIRSYPEDKSVEDILKEEVVNANIKVPTIPYQKFAGWRIISDDYMGNVEVQAVYTRVADTFEVIINYATKPSETFHVPFNERFDIVGSDSSILGWEMNSTKVSATDEYTFYVTSDTYLTEISLDTNINNTFGTINMSKPTQDGVIAITGNMAQGVDITYDEVGFIFAKPDMNNDIFLIENLGIMKVQVYTIQPISKQIIASVDAASFDGHKVRMYAIKKGPDNKLEYYYSNIVEIVGGNV